MVPSIPTGTHPGNKNLLHVPGTAHITVDKPPALRQRYPGTQAGRRAIGYSSIDFPGAAACRAPPKYLTRQEAAAGGVDFACSDNCADSCLAQQQVPVQSAPFTTSRVEATKNVEPPATGFRRPWRPSFQERRKGR